ncbi:hypothetical protein GCT13_38875 [Paraburkholderia sp. CNPSo 3157]|uniref:Uncharacterized protein n=1 Tax=Paraburkholderia franconis TaxID=2654983 RepID=A0A7X1NJI3_9BURK|nr:hypothetical protein [Paraburkholderia franconis]
MAYLSERENNVEQINLICLRMFDTWCKARNVTALTYLMHCWPMIDSTPAALRCLGETMRKLRRYHTDQLDENGFRALCEMADMIDDLIERPAPVVNLMAVGESPEKDS